MLNFIKRLFGLAPSENMELDTDEIVKEQWNADFSREDKPGEAPHVRFSITSENQYRAYLEGKALCLELKKNNCIAWSENTFYRYQDVAIKGKITLDPKNGYAAAGFVFRMVDDRTYYMILISNRGYFRLDLVRNSVPLTMAGWTETPLMQKTDAPFDVEMELVNYGSRILLTINGQWVGSWNDPSIPEGRLGFAIASYEDTGENAKKQGKIKAMAALRSFQLDSRIDHVAKRYEELEETAHPDRRIRLAETFIALGQVNPALVQLRKAWERREDLLAELSKAEDAVIINAIQGANPEYDLRPEKELLLAAKLAMALEQWGEASEYVEIALERDRELLPEFRNMKAAVLYSQGDYKKLIEWVCGLANKHSSSEQFDKLFSDPSGLYNLLGHGYFNTSDYQNAAKSYDYSFSLNDKNAMAAKNAGAAHELNNNGKEALNRYLKAGRAFFLDERYEELGLIVPKFQLLGKDNWEAAALTGKWAFAIENWKMAEAELERAEKLRKEKRGEEDPAIYFLQALLLVREGKRQKALEFFEKAVKNAPDYPLFRYRLAENRFLLDNNCDDPRLAADMEAALKVEKEDKTTYGWVHNFAAQIALNKGDVKQGTSHLEKAASVLGEIPEVRVNRAISLFLQDNKEEALAILESTPQEDYKGVMANCAGNLLVRDRRFEEADAYYQKALSLAPGNMLFRYNRGSCLIELSRYGEADDVLTNSPGELNPAMLELIAFVAVKKGEYKRAETAALSALKINPYHVPSMLQLGWSYAFTGRWDDVDDILDKLDEFELSAEAKKEQKHLEKWRMDSLYRKVFCESCKRHWQVLRDPGRIAPLKLYAMPPDDMPAGTCPGCGLTFCVGCRKNDLDESGRFVCPTCAKTLKLTDDGLKAILSDWAEKNIKKKRSKSK
jgi:tetratricopeptide (TPR) repeat protein